MHAVCRWPSRLTLPLARAITAGVLLPTTFGMLVAWAPPLGRPMAWVLLVLGIGAAGAAAWLTTYVERQRLPSWMGTRFHRGGAAAAIAFWLCFGSEVSHTIEATFGQLTGSTSALDAVLFLLPAGGGVGALFAWTWKATERAAEARTGDRVVQWMLPLGIWTGAAGLLILFCGLPTPRPPAHLMGMILVCASCVMLTAAALLAAHLLRVVDSLATPSDAYRIGEPISTVEIPVLLDASGAMRTLYRRRPADHGDVEWEPIACVPYNPEQRRGAIVRQRWSAVGFAAGALVLASVGVGSASVQARSERLLRFSAECSSDDLASPVVFVVIGDVSGFDPDTLAARYRRTFRLDVRVERIPAAVARTAYNPLRQQIDADILLAHLDRTYGETVVAFTDLDLFSTRDGRSFSFAFRSPRGRTSILSTARLAESRPWYAGDDEPSALLLARLSKLITQHVGLHLCRLESNGDPRSVLYDGIGSVYDLDAIDEGRW